MTSSVGTPSFNALVSIHDVMPSTLTEVAELLALCQQNQIESVMLLVVPGHDWSPRDVDRLRRWQDAGHELAGHGWTHRCRSIQGFRHRLHSLLISRDVAEHLCLTPKEIAELISRCGQWFENQNIAQPYLYVPPAWAMGAISTEQLDQTPFDLFEVLPGVLSRHREKILRLPLVGFEADTRFRQISVRCINRIGQAFANASTKPLRIGIHPRDHQLLLKNDLVKILSKSFQPVSYRTLLTDA